MRTISLSENSVTDSVFNFAQKNYNTYVQHYRSRNMTPMPLKEFLKNYTR
ncbi:hypothetical protein [Lutibacter sp.]|nr:hypothetical protein [Lutibacter sp.]MCF6181426.1 hypothetical protein [Lutibacter sp.]